MDWIVLLILLAPAAIIMAAYNRLALARTALKNAFAQIDVLLTRRYDLVPNLVESARGALGSSEQQTLEAVVRTCNEAYEGFKGAAGDPGSAAAVRQLSGAEAQLARALSRLMALAQAHPQLKSSQALLLFAEELKSTDSRVAFARRLYNQAVMSYNSDRESFPGSVAAGLFGFGPAYLLASERPPAPRPPARTEPIPEHSGQAALPEQLPAAVKTTETGESPGRSARYR